MSYRVRLTREAEADIAQLFGFAPERELAQDAIHAIHAGIATLKASPFTCRKVGRCPSLRELVIPFGRSGYVALFEV